MCSIVPATAQTAVPVLIPSDRCVGPGTEFTSASKSTTSSWLFFVILYFLYILFFLLLPDPTLHSLPTPFPTTGPGPTTASSRPGCIDAAHRGEVGGLQQVRPPAPDLSSSPRPHALHSHVLSSVSVVLYLGLSTVLCATHKHGHTGNTGHKAQTRDHPGASSPHFWPGQPSTTLARTHPSRRLLRGFAEGQSEGKTRGEGGSTSTSRKKVRSAGARHGSASTCCCTWRQPSTPTTLVPSTNMCYPHPTRCAAARPPACTVPAVSARCGTSVPSNPTQSSALLKPPLVLSPLVPGRAVPRCALLSRRPLHRLTLSVPAPTLFSPILSQARSASLCVSRNPATALALSVHISLPSPHQTPPPFWPPPSRFSLPELRLLLTRVFLFCFSRWARSSLFALALPSSSLLLPLLSSSCACPRRLPSTPANPLRQPPSIQLRSRRAGQDNRARARIYTTRTTTDGDELSRST